MNNSINQNNLLKNVTADCMMDMEQVTELYNMKKLEEDLKNFCDTSKIKYRENLNQYYVYVKKKQFTAKTKKELLQKLHNHFCGDKNRTFEQAFEEWMLWRRSIQTAPKTLQENMNEYKSFIKKTSLAKSKIVDIDVTNLENFFYEVTKDFGITSKRLSNVSSVVNGVLKRCVSLKLIKHNPLSDVDMAVFRRRCKPKNTSKDNYTLEEREKILRYLSFKDDPYSLAISLSFFLTIRIGELLAIKREDIQDKQLLINRSKREYREMNDDFTFSSRMVTNEERIKGNKDTGFRCIPLTDKAMAIIEKTLELYPEQEYLFMRNGRQLIGDVFNRHLRATCEHLKIKYRSSHQIRFTVASTLYERGVSITQLSSIMGHANTNTTWLYVRKSKEISDDTVQTMVSVLD